MHEQVAGWWEALDRLRLGPDGRYRALHLPAITLVPPCHTPAVSLPALAMQPGAVLTHLGKLHHERAHIARGRCSEQYESTHLSSPNGLNLRIRANLAV